MKRAKKLTRAERKEAQRAAREKAAATPKTKKPLKIKPMFSLTKYLARKEEKKHGHDHHH
jgi:hypothetical protein